jgi:RHS repeat-associated protein
MKRLWLSLFALLLLALTGSVMADGTPPSWTIYNGSNFGLAGSYSSAPVACTAWYQHWQAYFANLAQYGVKATVTYQAPYVATNPSAPTATSEQCATPVSMNGSQVVYSAYLQRTPACSGGNGFFNPNTDQCIAPPTDDTQNAGNAGDCDGGVGNATDGVVECPGTVMVNDPINIATGNKFEQDTDFRGSTWLTFRRFYNSVTVASATLGPQWRHSFDRSLNIQLSGSGGSTTPTIQLYRPDGSSEPFQKINGVWTANADMADTLTEQDDANGNPTGYTVFIAPRREYEQYSTSGLLQSITNAAGQMALLAYSTASTPTSVAPSPNLLLTVTDPNGRQLSFTYNSNGTVAQVTQPDGGTLTYGYNATGNLASVQYPDGKTLQYVYNESSLNSGTSQPNILTGVIDETATRFASTGYNSTGQAISFTQAVGANAGSATYSSDGSATLNTPLGTTLTMQSEIDGSGTLKLGAVSSPCGTQCTQPWQSQTYDGNGNPASYTDFNNNVTATTFNSVGLLTQKIEAQGTANQRTTNTTWNNTLHVPLARVMLDSNGNTVASKAWVYNASGQTLAKCEIDPTVSAAASYSCSNTGTVPAGVRRWTYTYCTAVDTTRCPVIGLMLTATGPRTDVTQATTYTYYLSDSTTAHHGDLQSVTDALGHTTTYLSYDGAGRVLSQQDANGVTTTFTYYPRGWLKTLTIGGATTSYTYTAYGKVATVTDPDNVTTTYGYDNAHRLTSITDAQGNSIQYTLDASGNRTAENTYAAGSTTASRTVTRQYNALGQLIKVTDGLGNVTFNASASGNYDSNGNLVLSSDANGYQTQRTYDALNRLAKTINNYNGTDTATQNTTTAQTQDALDRVTSITDPSSLTTTYGFDGLSDATSLQSPDAGTSSSTYDAAGNVLTHTDAKGIISTSTYDALDRLTSVSYSDSAQTNDNVTYSYDDANSVTACATSSPIGHLTRVIENAVTTIYCYDLRGNITSKQQVTSAGTDTTIYSYTAANRLNGITYPSGTQVSYAFDTDGRIQSATLSPVGGSASTVVSSITYMPFGPINGYTLGNGQTITRTYNANYALTDLTSPALNLHFARDLMGNINAEGNAAGANPATESYTYDPLYRLLNIAQGSTNIETLTYNPTGDRTSKSGSGLATGNYGYQSGTHWLTTIGSAARTYDANGNTSGNSTAGQTYGYGYNGRNRMTVFQADDATVGTYTYNAMGQRIQKVATLPAAITQRFGYDEADHLIGEYGSDNRDYVWLEDIPVATVDIAGTTSTVSYITADQLGTPRAVSNSAGAQVWSWPYVGNPFGETAPTSTTGYVLNLRYQGQYYDAESGLNFNYHRDYDSETGRYLQADPLGFGGNQSSWYAYVNGDPLNSSDPSGTAPRFNPRSPRFWCTWCGGPHGGLFGNYCPDCYSKSQDPDGQIPADPGSNDPTKEPSETCPDGKCQKMVPVVVMGVGGAYIVYRCVRMLPSLLPPLWWTIPENIAIP